MTEETKKRYRASTKLNKQGKRELNPKEPNRNKTEEQIAKEARKAVEDEKRTAMLARRKARKAREVPGAAKEKNLPNVKIDGMVTYWANDTKNNLAKKQKIDYDFAELDDEQRKTSGLDADSNGRISKVVGVNPDGTPQRAYLMAKYEDFYNEDLKEKTKRIAALDPSNRKARIEGISDDLTYDRDENNV